MEDYQRLTEASERGDAEGVEKASRQLEAALRVCARNLCEKYLAPPSTTDFGILFLSTEGLYAEAMRRPGLADSIQRDYRIVLSGPSTLAALLNAGKGIGMGESAPPAKEGNKSHYYSAESGPKDLLKALQLLHLNMPFSA
jgi:RmuC family